MFDARPPARLTTDILILITKFHLVKTWLKTVSILFGSVRKLKKASKMKISCNNVEIETKSSVKYLGVVLDQDMTRKTNCGNVRVNSVLKFLYGKKQYSLKFRNRKLLCSALSQSRFDYSFKVFSKQPRTKWWDSHLPSLYSTYPLSTPPTFWHWHNATPQIAINFFVDCFGFTLVFSGNYQWSIAGE